MGWMNPLPGQMVISFYMKQILSQLKMHPDLLARMKLQVDRNLKRMTPEEVSARDWKLSPVRAAPANETVAMALTC